jgi:hypothetical protein
LLDYLEEYFVLNDISAGNVRSMNGNYLYPFAELSNYYERKGDIAKAQHYRKLSLKVATEGEIGDRFEKLFSGK